MLLSDLHTMEAPDILNEKLYRKLKDYIHSKGYTYDQIGQITGFSSDHISKVVNLKRNPSLRFVQNMALALQTRPSKLGLNFKVKTPDRRTKKVRGARRR
jgi:transcriptional regulator with XRE-family HTH domain